MSNGQNLRKFWQQWVIANTVSFPISFALVSFVDLALSIGVKSTMEHNTRLTVTYVSFAVSNLVIGLIQWLVLRRQVSRISICWILTSIPGLHIGVFVSFFLALNIVSFLFQIGFFAEYVQMFVGSAVAGAVGGAMGGGVTGIAQSLLIARKILLNHLWIIWILTSTVAWAASWSAGWAFGSVVGVAMGNAVSSSLFAKVSTATFGVIFGIICGFLNGTITGKVLVWALRRSRI